MNGNRIFLIVFVILLGVLASAVSTADITDYWGPSYPPNGSGDWPLDLILQWIPDDNNSGVIEKYGLLLTNVTDGTASYVILPESQHEYCLCNPDIWDIIFYGKDYTWQITALGPGDVVLAQTASWSFSTMALECTGLSAYADIDGSNDCIVNLADLAVIASTWLECGWQLPDGNGGYTSIPYQEKDPCLW